jgi:hypothetical protein
VSIRQHAVPDEDEEAYMPAYESIRQHTSAYVSIRQHAVPDEDEEAYMSAHVSIRQHTSAYVSIRQHAVPDEDEELTLLRGDIELLQQRAPHSSRHRHFHIHRQPQRLLLHTSAYVSIRQHTSA